MATEDIYNAGVSQISGQMEGMRNAQATGTQLGIQLAQTQVKLEDEKQQMLITKQNHDAEKLQKMYSIFSDVTQTQDPAKRKMGTKLLESVGSAFGVPTTPDAAELLRSSDQFRSEASAELAKLDPTNPAHVAIGIKAMKDYLGSSNPLDGVNAFKTAFSGVEAYKIAELRRNEWANKIDANSVGKVLDQFGKTGALAGIDTAKQQILQRWAGKPTELSAYMKNFPDSPDAQAFREYQQTGAATQQGKDQLAATAKQHAMDVADTRVKQRWVSLGLADQRIRNATLDQVTTKNPNVRKSDLLIDAASRVGDLIAGRPMDKVDRDIARTELARMATGTGVVSRGAMSETEFSDYTTKVNDILRFADAGKPIPQDIGKLVMSKVDAMREATIKLRDQDIARGLGIMTKQPGANGKPRLDPVTAQDVMDAAQRGDNRILVSSQATKNSASAKQATTVDSYDLSQLNPNAPKGMTVAQAQAMINAEPDPSKKAARQGQLNRMKMQILKKLGK